VTEVIVGALYENKFGEVEVADWPAIVTTTCRLDPMPLGITQGTLVCTNPGEAMLHTRPPTVIEPDTPKFVPVIVIMAPPEVKSELGEIEVIVGAA
jgi:hypothetical protein